MDLALISSVKELGPEFWRTLELPHFPFTDYEFLAALESSLGSRRGWQPLYMVARDASGPLAVQLLYAKGHSYGEYIFDWAWADFFQRYGRAYYPKLLSAIPFTPATGSKILVRDPEQRGELSRVLIEAARSLAQQNNLSSYHALFIEESEHEAYRSAGLMLRHSLQFHWQNEGYRDFADFLDRFQGKRRRDVLRERRVAAGHGLELVTLTGSDLTPEHAKAMRRLYLMTIAKKQSTPYLAEDFFDEVFRTMADRILMTAAFQDGELVAGALNFFKGEKIYGRYWGALEAFQNLHFELCYYRVIDEAIARGFRTFEAGAQGEHKVQRGFLPSLTYSAHEIYDTDMSRPIQNAIEAEKIDLAEAMGTFTSPFRESPSETVPPR